MSREGYVAERLRSGESDAGMRVSIQSAGLVRGKGSEEEF